MEVITAVTTTKTAKTGTMATMETMVKETMVAETVMVGPGGAAMIWNLKAMADCSMICGNIPHLKMNGHG